MNEYNELGNFKIDLILYDSLQQWHINIANISIITISVNFNLTKIDFAMSACYNS